MSNNEIVSKIEELKELEALIREAEAEVEALKEDIKKVLTEQNTEELTAGRYVVRWTSVVSNRFDTTTFKKEMEELYNRYIKETKSKRFSIVG